MQSFKNWYGKRVKRSQTGTAGDFKTPHTTHSPVRPRSLSASAPRDKLSLPNGTEKRARNSASSFTSSLKDLLMPPEERRRSKRAGTAQEEAMHLLQDIISSHGDDSPKTLSSYIALHNTRGKLCNQRSDDLLLALVLQGVDESTRGELWLSASGGKQRMLVAQPGYFSQLCSAETKDDDATTVAIKQIDLDVGRTAGAGSGGSGGGAKWQ